MMTTTTILTRNKKNIVSVGIFAPNNNPQQMYQDKLKYSHHVFYFM
jgi:hypothetical protein